VSVIEVTTTVPGRVRRPEWVAHVLDEAAEPPRAVLLHLPSGKRTGLSDTATRVWQEVVASGDAGIEVDTIAATLAAEYGADPQVVTHDVTALLTEMAAGEWVEVVPEHEEGDQA
jgi:hypothetical protein